MPDLVVRKAVVYHPCERTNERARYVNASMRSLNDVLLFQITAPEVDVLHQCLIPISTVNRVDFGTYLTPAIERSAFFSLLASRSANQTHRTRAN